MCLALLMLLAAAPLSFAETDWSSVESAYRKLVTERWNDEIDEDLSPSHYTLTDIDKDGIPELLIGMKEVSYSSTNVYTFAKGKAKLLGEIDEGHARFYAIAEKNGLVECYEAQGHIEIIVWRLKGSSLVPETVYDEDFSGDSYPPPGKFVPGAQSLTYYKCNDLSGLSMDKYRAAAGNDQKAAKKGSKISSAKQGSEKISLTELMKMFDSRVEKPKKSSILDEPESAKVSSKYGKLIYVYSRPLIGKKLFEAKEGAAVTVYARQSGYALGIVDGTSIGGWMKENYLVSVKKKTEKEPEDAQTDQQKADSLIAKGLQYERGDGKKQDYLKAAECYKQAIGLGSAEAKARLAVLYIKDAVSYNRRSAYEGILGDPVFEKVAALGVKHSGLFTLIVSRMLCDIFLYTFKNGDIL